MSARLFVAVDIAEEDRVVLANWASEVVGDDEGLRVVDTEKLHVTLAFLGHRALDEVSPAAAVVQALASPAFVLPTAGALWLSPRRPHVLTVALEDPSGLLDTLHGAAWDGLEEALGVARERRRFRPHVTVARVRHGWTAPTRPLAPPPERELRAEAVTLYRSHLGGRGPARYEALERRLLS